MWNTVILPIITSLTATGLGILLVSLFNRKRQDDARANQIAHILNEISDIRNKIANGLERSALDTEKNERLRQEIREDVEGIRQDNERLRQEIREDVEGIRQDVAGLKQDVEGMKQDVAGIKTRR